MNNHQVLWVENIYILKIKVKKYRFKKNCVFFAHRNAMEDYKFLFKVVLVGNAGVGKTCLVRRFTQGLFPPGQGATIGVDFMIKTVEVEGEKIKVYALYHYIHFTITT